MATHWMVVTETWKSRPECGQGDGDDRRVEDRHDRPQHDDGGGAAKLWSQTEGRGRGGRHGNYFIILKDRGLSKSFNGGTIATMGTAEEAFERLRRIAFEGEHVERMAALGGRMKLSPGVIKTLMRLGRADGISMGEMARGIGCDPSYITALVDDLDERGLARREPSPDDRRVKIIVLTDDRPGVGGRDRRHAVGPARRLLSPLGRGTRPAAPPVGQGARARRCHAWGPRRRRSRARDPR